MTTTTTRTRPDALVDADWLEQHLADDDLRIVEMDVSPDAHAEGHIPGAVLWNIYSDLKDGQYRPRDLEAIGELIRRSGISEDSTVVFYGYAPALGFWLMRYCGFDNVHVLDASREAWRVAGRTWTSTPTETTPSDHRIDGPTNGLRATQRSVEEAIERGETILDVRSHLEYVGERFWPSGGIPDGGRVGRIPTAVHLPADDLIGPDGSFRSIDELTELLAHDALGGGGPVTTYCTVGARAATVWFVLTELLGRRNVNVYDGSWTEWGMADDTAIVVG